MTDAEQSGSVSGTSGPADAQQYDAPVTRTPHEPTAASGPPTIDGTPCSRVLVFHIGSLGDTVLTVPALQALRSHLGPSATISLLHNGGADGRVAPTAIIPEGLLDDVLSFLDPVGPSADQHPGTAGSVRAAARRAVGAGRRTFDAVALLRRLRRRRFDAVVNLALADRSARSLRRDRVFYRLCGIETVVGFEAESPGRPEAEARLDRLRRVGIPAELGDGPWIAATDTSAGEATRWRTGAGLGPGRPIVTIAPGTLMDAKRWPVDRWGSLGARLRDELGLEPVVVGGPADRAEGDRLVAAWGGGANGAGALSPAGSAALMATAELHIGVDTGTTHLAAAAGTPVVALYSHRAPIIQWAPMGRGHRIVDHPVPCAGCAAVVCPVADHPCMTEITVDEVWAQVEAARARVTTHG